MGEQNKGTGLVRILSGINSINFNVGYDPKSKIFDKRKTSMPQPLSIFCLKDEAESRIYDLDDQVVKDLLAYSISHLAFRKGERYIMSGLVDEIELRPANFGYWIGPELEVDRLFKYVKGLWVPERIIDISNLL